MYFYCMLIDMINDYKNIYSHNNNVCLGVCGVIFMRIDIIKKGYLKVFYEHIVRSFEVYY